MSSRIAALTKEGLIAINKRFSATSKLILPNELESALARPDNKEHYDKTATPADLAASLAFGLIKNHPFQDANKRTAHEAAKEYYKAKTGKTLPETREVQDAHLKVAKSEMDEDALATVYKNATK